MDNRYLQAFRSAGAAKKVKWQGRDHYVVPVVALMEGVIHAVNAENAEFVPFRTFSQNVSQWNGRPLMLGHPVRNGVHITANEPTVLESACFGSTFNARIYNKRLMMDAYVDPERLIALGQQDLLKSVIEGTPIEISIGAGVATDAELGEHNGKRYKGKWIGLSADHLAFLPGGRGACSLEMGCGAHRAMAAQEDLMGDDDSIASKIAAAVMKILGGKGSGHFGHAGRPGQVGGSADSDESGGNPHRQNDGHGGTRTPVEGDYVKIKGNVRGEGKKGVVTGGDRDGSFLIVKGHDGEKLGSYHVSDLIVEDEDEEDEPNSTESGDDKPKDMTRDQVERAKYADRKNGDLIAKSPKGNVEKYGDPKRPFAARAKNGELLGTYSTIANAKEAIHNQAAVKQPENFPSGWRNPAPQPKWRDLEERDLAAYEDCPMCQGSGETNGNPCDGCKGTGEMKVAEHHGDTDMTRQGLIDKITGCSCSGFTKADLKGLEALTDAGLKALADYVEKKEKDDEDDEEAKKKAEDEKRTLEAKVATLETELRAASTKKLTLDEFKARAPEEVLTLLAEKEARDAAEINELVTGLKAASEGIYTEAELRAMSAPQLRNLAKIAKVPAVDFAGRGVPVLRAAGAGAADFTPPNPYDAVLKPQSK